MHIYRTINHTPANNFFNYIVLALVDFGSSALDAEFTGTLAGEDKVRAFLAVVTLRHLRPVYS